MRQRIITMFICVLFCIVSCGNHTEAETVHNEIYGVFTEADGNVYYIKKYKELYEYKDGESNMLYDNVICLQKHGEDVYFITVSDNHEDYTVSAFDNGEIIKCVDLPSGTFQQCIIYGNNLYACINQKITVYDLETWESKDVPIENPVNKFCILDGSIYYWNIRYTDIGMDEYVEDIGNNTESMLFDNSLYVFDMNEQKSEKIFGGQSSEYARIVSPTKYGVVYYDTVNKALSICKKGSEPEIIVQDEADSFVTDDENVFYTSGGTAYCVHIRNKKKEVFKENVYSIYGVNNQYAYCGDSVVERQ